MRTTTTHRLNYKSKNTPSTFSTTHDIDWIGGGTGTLQRSMTSEHAPHTTTTTTPELSVTPDEAPLLVGLHESYNDIDIRSTIVS
jgi:hypothetical protein